MGLFSSKKEKSLDERVNEIINSDDEVKRVIEYKPELRQYLVDSYRRAYESGKGIKYFGNFIDKVRKPLGFLKLLGNLAGPGIGYLASGLARIGELALFTLPYSIYYGLKGGKAKEIGKIVGTEVAKIPIPYGDVANFIPIYSKAASNYINNTAKKYFMEGVKRKGFEADIDTGRNLEEVLKEQPLPEEVSSRSNPIGTSPRRAVTTRARERV